MIELPETYVLSEQINNTLKNKVIAGVKVNASPHKFAWFNDNPNEYSAMLTGKKITSSNPGTGYTCGGNTEIIIDDMLMVISTPIKYHAQGEKIPEKHQLLLQFTDLSSLSCTVQMWGAMFCYAITENGLPDNFKVNKSPTPLTDEFDEMYFDKLIKGKAISAKAFLATEQRIPGLGNGVLQDILFNCRINPKRKINTLLDKEKESMFHSVKNTLLYMKQQGGRDTEKDFFAHPGGYKTILSKKTANNPCPVCGGYFIREAYMGGNIYYCPVCQPI